ncbi:MAG: efflux RND transporter permease subunit [Gammaproteobacteria bacterium]|nr:efflux RND transporter permease subunit [Gammaproteobacteria bacterium]
MLDVSGGQNGGQSDLTLVLGGDDLPFGKEQIILEPTPRARALGLSTADLGSQLRAAYSGALVQIYNQNQSEVEVRVVLPEDEQDDLSKLQQFPGKTPAGTLVPLGNLAVLHNRRGIDVIRHTDAQMAVRIYADYAYQGQAHFNGEDGARELLKAFDLPAVPHSTAIAMGRPIGPCRSFPSQDAWVDDPVLPGGTLIGDAAS